MLAYHNVDDKEDVHTNYHNSNHPHYDAPDTIKKYNIVMCQHQLHMYNSKLGLTHMEFLNCPITSLLDVACNSGRRERGSYNDVRDKNCGYLAQIIICIIPASSALC